MLTTDCSLKFKVTCQQVCGSERSGASRSEARSSLALRCKPLYEMLSIFYIMIPNLLVKSLHKCECKCVVTFMDLRTGALLDVVEEFICLMRVRTSRWVLGQFLAE